MHRVCNRVQRWLNARRRKFVFLILTAWSQQCCEGRARSICCLPCASISKHSTRHTSHCWQKLCFFSSTGELSWLFSTLLCFQFLCTFSLRPQPPYPFLPHPALLLFLVIFPPITAHCKQEVVRKEKLQMYLSSFERKKKNCSHSLR